MTTSSNANIANTGNFLRTSRTYPLDPKDLSVELSKTYLDIANEVNARTSGVFGTGSQQITSEQWFLDGEAGRQFTLRQAYTFTSAGTIPHGLNMDGITGFTRIFGSFQDNSTPPKFFPLPYVNAVNANNQIEVNIDSDNINIIAGGGSPPVIISGVVVLEWLSQV